MSKASVYYWAPSSGAGYQDGIATTQFGSAGVPIVLVANTPEQPGAFSYRNTINPNTSTSSINANVIRSITITSVVGIGGTTFTIKGLGCDQIDTNGNPLTIVHPVTEEIDVAASGTNISDYLYTEIYSISSSNDVASVYVGYGPEGITAYTILDANVNVIQGYSTSFTVQAIPPAFTTTTADVYISLNKPEYPNGNGGTVPFGIINGQQLVFMPAYLYQADPPSGNDSYFSYTYTGFQTIWLNIQSATPTVDSLIFTVLQQGI